MLRTSNYIQLHNLRVITLIAIGTCCFHRDSQAVKYPKREFFGGIEDRVKSADAIMMGVLHPAGVLNESKRGECRVSAEFKIENIVRGVWDAPSLSCWFLQQAFRFRGEFGARPASFGRDDERGLELVWSLSKSKESHILGFFKRTDSGWELFYAAPEDLWLSVRQAVAPILAIEELNDVAQKRGKLKDILADSPSELVRKYAIRSILKLDYPWSIKTSDVLEYVRRSDSPALQGYAFRCICAHIFYHCVSAADEKDSLQTVTAMLDDMKEYRSLKTGVSALRPIAHRYKRFPELREVLKRRLSGVLDVVKVEKAKGDRSADHWETEVLKLIEVLGTR